MQRTSSLIAYSVLLVAGAFADAPSPRDPAPVEFPGLHQVVAYHEGFYSGSAPEGEAGFESLVNLGIRTIITVDGAEPEVERARAHGIRYIHLPMGYNGFDDQRKLELVRASRDAIKLGPVYVHCHHGKHRSAGAAATVAVSLGWASPDQMIERMKVSGTSPHYEGLYACAANATPLSAEQINAVAADFPETAKPTSFVNTMIELDEILEHLQQIERTGWVAPVKHPDLVPAAEAGRMVDLFRGLADSDEKQGKSADLVVMLQQSHALAQRLEDMLLSEQDRQKERSAQLKQVSTSCNDCHVRHRDK